ncbi:OLC1v1013701C1 [Oldenlandia corymbosa var. corymbosa]|uniref:OLC1v1013701C1 n=1 Tax=Oldenlandia corymbosa var. corymbosa TaxID=529605 RepID=A0AAV1DYZ7_OLDCO|nr:OLC1v1013701C1 [Oldenlandia corymbosa var. corymbosa]
MAEIKKEILVPNSPDSNPEGKPSSTFPSSVIDLSSSDSDCEDFFSGPDDDGVAGDSSHKRPKKKTKLDKNVALPLGFLEPLPLVVGPESSPATGPAPLAMQVPTEVALALPAPGGGMMVKGEYNSKQFWKAGDYDGAPTGDWQTYAGGMDHVRVHPRFLHSNATSHKWVLGAFAELLDNALDEVRNGATYVNVDMIKNKKDGNRMLLIEDNGGGMDPDKMRQCMSLGYSAKSKIADTIGQYGNGFKTSTMRLGADVIVFSRSYDRAGNRSTQSIGLLSFTFLRDTGKEDIVVPMLDYERDGQDWKKIIRSSATDWNTNVDTIVQWSPFSSEADLLDQFNQIKDHGTRIFIYNLWEDDQGLLELDFDVDPHDIQIRGVNRDEKHIQMAQQYPNSRHFLTYRHSLRSYASILYLRVPPSFRIILRGKDVEHHNIVNDMMMSQEVTYRPQSGTDGVPRDSTMMAVVTVGFVKDAKAHIDVQGFNVYHKNRLIKPFWRVWHPPGSDGRGVIGVLEANFVEPAHDKQGFERTTVLSRLEAKLIQMQKNYWNTYCHKIGYNPRRSKKLAEREGSPESLNGEHIESNGKAPRKENRSSASAKSGLKKQDEHLENQNSRSRRSGRRNVYAEESSPSAEYVSDHDGPYSTDPNADEGPSADKSLPSKRSHGKDSASIPSSFKHTPSRGTRKNAYEGRTPGSTTNVEEDDIGHDYSQSLQRLEEENRVLKEKLRRKEEEFLGDLLKDLDKERSKCKSMETELQEAREKIQELSKEQDSLIDLFSEERQRHETEEETLRKKLKDASNTIQELVEKVRRLEKLKSPSSGRAK